MNFMMKCFKKTPYNAFVFTIRNRVNYNWYLSLKVDIDNFNIKLTQLPYYFVSGNIDLTIYLSKSIHFVLMTKMVLNKVLKYVLLKMTPH